MGHKPLAEASAGVPAIPRLDSAGNVTAGHVPAEGILAIAALRTKRLDPPDFAAPGRLDHHPITRPEAPDLPTDLSDHADDLMAHDERHGGDRRQIGAAL